MLVPVGVHAFVTVNKKGITLGAGPGIVSGSGVIVVQGRPFGQNTGTQVVSQVFGAYGRMGGYISGTPFSQAGPSYSLGGGFGTGAAFSITVDGTIHFDWSDQPWGP